MTSKQVQLFRGDCLEVMKDIEDKSIDMILCDLPYGTTTCKWDTVIPFEPLWECYKRLIKPNGAIVLTASQPFTSALIMSNIGMFKYCWVWDKVNRYTGALQVNKRPMRRHEDVCVFYKEQSTYNKQWRIGKKYNVKRTKGHGEYHSNQDFNKIRIGSNDGKHHNPCSVIAIKADNKKEMGLHPTQKPVTLFEYLIKTYTNKGDLVLDNCAGSGTTAIACINTKRKFIGIELDKGYYRMAKKRIRAAEKRYKQTFQL